MQMRVRWREVGVAALSAAACVAIYAALRRSQQCADAEKQKSTDRQIAALVTGIRVLQARVAELSQLAAERKAEDALAPADTENNFAEIKDPLEPEILAVITAAATTFLGKTVRLHSVKLESPQRRSISAWTRQGRMIEQTSHNLPVRDGKRGSN